jgi:hypothetical protein
VYVPTAVTVVVYQLHRAALAALHIVHPANRAGCSGDHRDHFGGHDIDTLMSPTSAARIAKGIRVVVVTNHRENNWIRDSGICCWDWDESDGTDKRQGDAFHLVPIDRMTERLRDF